VEVDSIPFHSDPESCSLCDVNIFDGSKDITFVDVVVEEVSAVDTSKDVLDQQGCHQGNG
jgi:hypothetical protein